MWVTYRYMSEWLSVACNFMSIFCKKMKNISSCEYDRWVVETCSQKKVPSRRVSM